EIVCDPAYPDEPIGPDLTSWLVFDKRDDAARVVQPRVDRHLHRCARLSRWCAERCAADLQRGPRVVRLHTEPVAPFPVGHRAAVRLVRLDAELAREDLLEDARRG